MYWCISYAMARGYGILDVDRRIRRLCLIREGERGYTGSMLSRFTRRVGAERLRLIIEEKVVTLLRRSRVEEVNAVPDASLVKAWITRHPRDSRRGFSDTDAMRDGRGYDLGYKLHISVEHERILPLAGVRILQESRRAKWFQYPNKFEKLETDTALRRYREEKILKHYSHPEHFQHVKLAGR